MKNALHDAEMVATDIDYINVHGTSTPVSYTHLRAHETVLDHVCRLLLEKNKVLTLPPSAICITTPPI